MPLKLDPLTESKASRPLLFKLRSEDQQQYQYLGACQKFRISDIIQTTESENALRRIALVKWFSDVSMYLSTC